MFSDMQVFVAPEDIPVMLRQSLRQEELIIHVASIGVIADNEKDIRDFGALCKKRKATVFSRDEKHWLSNQSINKLVETWRESRKNGAAKIGARISADRKKAAGKAGADKIADRWPKSSDEFPTRALLAEAEISLNTAKAHLGKRPIAQYNYQAAQKRKAQKLQLPVKK
jgi:putative heme degradation protein